MKNQNCVCNACMYGFSHVQDINNRNIEYRAQEAEKRFLDLAKQHKKAATLDDVMESQNKIFDLLQKCLEQSKLQTLIMSINNERNAK